MQWLHILVFLFLRAPLAVCGPIALGNSRHGPKSHLAARNPGQNQDPPRRVDVYMVSEIANNAKAVIVLDHQGHQYWRIFPISNAYVQHWELDIVHTPYQDGHYGDHARPWEVKSMIGAGVKFEGLLSELENQDLLPRGLDNSWQWLRRAVEALAEKGYLEMDQFRNQFKYFWMEMKHSQDRYVGWVMQNSEKATQAKQAAQPPGTQPGSHPAERYPEFGKDFVEPLLGT